MPAEKEAEIKARVERRLKKAVSRLAQKRGESESMILREALNYYLEHHPAAIGKYPAPAIDGHYVIHEESKPKTKLAG